MFIASGEEHDFFAAVIPSDVTGSDYNVMVKWLVNDFARSDPIQCLWPILWPEKPTKSQFLTYLDVKQDPIITELRNWINNRRSSNRKLAPPEYPVTSVRDPRPRIDLPEAFKALSVSNVLTIFSGIQYSRQCAVIRDQPMDEKIAFMTKEVQQERYRQWKRLTATTNKLTFDDIISCLGLFSLVNQKDNVVSMVEYQLQNVHPRVEGWFNDKDNMWNIDLCLMEIRAAAVFIEQLQLRNVNLSADV